MTEQNAEIAPRASAKDLKDFFREECKKKELNADDYMEEFDKRIKRKKIATNEEIIAYVKWLKQAEKTAKEPRKSQATLMVEYVNSHAYLFRDQYDREYARVFLPWVEDGTNASYFILYLSPFFLLLPFFTHS